MKAVRIGALVLLGLCLVFIARTWIMIARAPVETIQEYLAWIDENRVEIMLSYWMAAVLFLVGVGVGLFVVARKLMKPAQPR